MILFFTVQLFIDKKFNVLKKSNFISIQDDILNNIYLKINYTYLNIKVRKSGRHRFIKIPKEKVRRRS